MPATIFTDPIFPGAKIITASLTVTNTSGSYSTTVTDDRMTGSMKAIALEIDDPSIFNAKISVNATAGQYTFSCSDVAGSTTVVISFVKTADDPTELTSSEFDVLNNRIGDLTTLTTTAKTSAVAAVNEVNDHIANPTNITGLTSHSNVTINDSHCYKLGNTVFGNIRFTASQTITDGTQIIFGLPRGITTLANGSAFASCSVNRSDASFTIVNGINDANIVVVGSTSARMYVVSFIYQCE